MGKENLIDIPEILARKDRQFAGKIGSSVMDYTYGRYYYELFEGVNLFLRQLILV